MAKPTPVLAPGNTETGHLDHGHSHERGDPAQGPTITGLPLLQANVSALGLFPMR